MYKDGVYVPDIGCVQEESDVDVTAEYVERSTVRTTKPTRPSQTGRSQTGGSHYQMPIEPVDYIYENGLGYMEGNVVKYITRHQSKNGEEDVIKAIDYCNMILEKKYGHKAI